jgi:hypothetical protein
MSALRGLLEPRWRVVWFLTLASALNFGDRSAMSAVLAAVRADFGSTDVLLGLLRLWVFFTWLPLYFRETYNMSLGSAGFSGTFMLQVSVVLGVLAGGWISDRVSANAPHRRMLLYSAFYLVGAPCLLLFLGEPSFVVVACGISLFSFMRGVASSNDNPSQCEVVPPQFRATGIGIMNAVATASGGCSVSLAGFLKREVGLGIIFAGISGCFLLASALLFVGYLKFMRHDIARAQAACETETPGANRREAEHVPS